VAAQVVLEAAGYRLPIAHLDVDTTVEAVFGELEGAAIGYNPRYHGRPSYHPIVARLAELDMLVGLKLRPGDTSFGDADVPYLETLIDRARRAVGTHAVLYVRIDSAGDCDALMRAINQRGAYFVTKARITADLAAAIPTVKHWNTVDEDADGRPTRQVAEVGFQRATWQKGGPLPVRVIAVRSKERPGKQLPLLDLDWTYQVFLTNDWHEAPDEVALRYDKRAAIEPLIAELKGAWGIADVPSRSFHANAALLLIKGLSLNLLRRFANATARRLRTWRTPWLRRALILIPGRLVSLRPPHHPAHASSPAALLSVDQSNVRVGERGSCAWKL
jgi:hypothetical protein